MDNLAINVIPQLVVCPCYLTPIIRAGDGLFSCQTRQGHNNMSHDLQRHVTRCYMEHWPASSAGAGRPSCAGRGRSSGAWPRGARTLSTQEVWGKGRSQTLEMYPGGSFMSRLWIWNQPEGLVDSRDVKLISPVGHISIMAALLKGRLYKLLSNMLLNNSLCIWLLFIWV